MAAGFSITNAVAAAMQTALATATDAGTAATITIYDSTGGVPTDANAAIGTCAQLAQLTCSATAFTATTTANPSVLTMGAIGSDTSADSTGTAAFFRIHTQSDKVTCIAQGTAGVGSFDLALNTTSFTSGSTVSITSATVSLPAS
jgi:hypothetical protein